MTRMPEHPHLPELTRSLRSLGASGGACMDEAHEAIFAPLLEARAAAMRASVGGTVDAMNGHAIVQRIESAVIAAATRGITNPPRERALSARALDATESVRRSLLALDELAAVAATDAGWNDWVDQLRRVFSAADVSCRALVAVLEERDVKDAPPRWYARNTR